MSQRVVALLLVAAWQLQAAVPPHFHPGMSAGDLIAHGERRHLHLHAPQVAHDPDAYHHAHHKHADARHDHAHSHGHAASDEDPFADVVCRPSSHDETAIYVGSGSPADVTGGSPRVMALEVAVSAAIDGDATRWLEQHTSAPPRYGGQVPACITTARLLL